MSSLRNAVKRITHKERSQPRSRSHLGLLEKHKDYKVRSRDYHAKAERIADMRRKASMRNPDEFYFGMHKSQVSREDGKHRRTEQARQEDLKDVIGADAVRIMKDQDLSYVRMQIQKDAHKVGHLESTLHLIDDGGGNVKNKKRKHSIFVDTSTEAENFDAAAHFDTAPETVDRTFNRPRLSTLLKNAAKEKEEYDLDSEDEDDKHKFTKKRLTTKEIKKQNKELKVAAKKAAKARSAAYSELEARRKRKTTLELAEAHLVTEKIVHAKGRKRKIKDAENGRPAVYKWRRRRAG